VVKFFLPVFFCVFSYVIDELACGYLKPTGLVAVVLVAELDELDGIDEAKDPSVSHLSVRVCVASL
jgi:hypothetical protein